MYNIKLITHDYLIEAITIKYYSDGLLVTDTWYSKLLVGSTAFIETLKSQSFPSQKFAIHGITEV